MPKQATAPPPIGHLDPTRTAEAFHFDDMSSMHLSIIDVDEEQQSTGRAQSHRSHVENNSAAVKSNSQFGGTDISERQVIARRKNAFMIVTLILFIGIVAAIAVAMAFAMQDKPIGADSREANQVLVEEELNSTINNADVVHESDNVTPGIGEFSPGFEDMSIETSIPTYNPTPSPIICIPLELGIIFDKNANQTEWKIIKGADGTTVNSEVVWQSTSYDATTYDSKAVTHKKCLPPQMYTFVFTDSDARSYVLSSEGNVIVTGMSIDSKDDIVAFELPFEVPEPVDKDGDGLEDRLGTLMPYDSSGLVEGVDCEPFLLELQTDDSGVETLWRLYEGQDNSGEMIADGGPFASNSNYVYEYCLKSPNIYTFYIYDWGKLYQSIQFIRLLFVPKIEFWSF